MPNVREYAFECLSHIFIDKSYSNIDLDNTIRSAKLSEKDRALLTNIVYGTLQHSNILKWEINLHNTSRKKLDRKMEVLLMLSLYQMRYLTKIPPYAILNEAVEIAKKIDGIYGSKFCNGVLRTLQREPKVPQISDFKDVYGYYQTIYNHPVWLIKMWENHYGKETTFKILEENLKEPPLTVRLDTNKYSKEELLKNPDFMEANLCENAFYYIGKESLWEKEESKKGYITVQDESSQNVAIILDPQENDNILDMCAAPGSKTVHIASLMKNTGKILAIDIHPHRVELINKSLKHHNLTNVMTKCYDSTILSTKIRHNYFDRILLDAPCSGFGVIRRKPDILLDMSPEKLDDIIALQEKLLENAYALLKVNGTLVYSTCTMSKKENENQIIKFISKHKDMKKVYEKQIFPFDYNSDGFYIAKLVKVGE